MTNSIPQMNLGPVEDMFLDPVSDKLDVYDWDPQKKQRVHQNIPFQVSHQSTLSSNVVPLNGSTTQSSLSNRVDNIIDKKFKNLRCSLTTAPFNDPVVDECGHTFERAAITDIYNNAIKKGIDFKCPISGNTLDFKRIVKNYNLSNVIPEIKKYVNKNEKRFDKINSDIDFVKTEVKELKENSNKQNRELNDTYGNFQIEMIRTFALENGCNNVINMGLFDRFISVFWPSHINTVFNKNQIQKFHHNNNPIKRNNDERLTCLFSFNKPKKETENSSTYK